MITGQEIRAARKRAGLSQEKLAQLVGVSQRSIGGWERGESSPGVAEGRLLAVLRDYLDEAGEQPLRAVSDVELLAEIARRFARAAEPAEPDFAEGGDHLEPKVADVLAARRAEEERRRAAFEFVEEAATDQVPGKDE